MERLEGKIDCIDIDDIKNIQRFVIANSFENLKFGNVPHSIMLRDGATVKAEVCDKKLKLGLNRKTELQADVECGEPVPSLDLVTPFIHQLLFRQRNFFTVKTVEKGDWVIVRFALFEPSSASKGVSESRGSISNIL